MAEPYQYREFRVAIRLIGNQKPNPTYHYLANNLDELFQQLWRNEGISESSVAECIIHEIMPDGSITELVSRRHPEALPVITDSANVAGLKPKTENTDSLVLGELVAILTKEEKEDKDPITITPLEPEGDPIYGGFKYVSYPARNYKT